MRFPFADAHCDYLYCDCFREYDIVNPIQGQMMSIDRMLEGNVKIGYHNGKIVATIDPKTGNLTHINYYYVWDLDVTVAGSNVKAPFGIESDFTINW